MAFEKVKLLGRTNEKEDKLLLRDSYTGLSFYCKGSITLTITPENETDKDSCPYVGIVVDDDILNVTKVAVTKELKDIKLLKNDGKLHKIDIVKLTEEQYGNVWLSSLHFEDEASVKKTETPDKSILFIGDSITAGYGVNGIDGEDDFTTFEENILGSSAIFTAKKTGSEVFVFARSGHGIISGWIPPEVDVPNKDGIIQNFFPFEGDTFPESDYIVINLGTNDNSYIRGREECLKLFKNEYTKFIVNLRKLYPLAKIFVAYGVMDTALLPAIRDLVKEYKEQSGDKNILFVKLEQQKESEGIGAAGHPSIAVNERVAESLAKVILENIQ
nr:SGNH/GDSL hydrolase family protein [uncultured Catonella sp.]